MSQQHMTTAEATAARVTATDLLMRRAIAVGALAALTVIGARLSVPLPGTPVPFTLQPVAVLLAGLLLGPVLGAGSQFAYLALGMAGLPVFAAGGGLAYLGGPTGGYLMAFPVAAAVAGWIFGDPDACGTLQRTLRIVAAGIAGLATVHLGGSTWLALQPWLTGAAGADVLRFTFEPFLLGDVLKIALVGVLTLGLGGRVRRLLG